VATQDEHEFSPPSDNGYNSDVLRGQGKFNKELAQVIKSIGQADGILLLVYDAKTKGSGYSIQASAKLLFNLSANLAAAANGMRAIHQEQSTLAKEASVLKGKKSRLPESVFKPSNPKARTVGRLQKYVKRRNHKPWYWWSGTGLRGMACLRNIHRIQILCFRQSRMIWRQ
jgi:hypothetical protein